MSFHADTRQEPFAILRLAIANLRDHEPRLFGLAVLLLAAMGPTIAAMLVDARVFLGVNVWQKPLKFEVALFVYALTLAFFARWFVAGVRQRTWYRIYIGAVIFAVIAEMIWISGAATLGTASHFNTTGIGAAIFPAMGVLAVLLTSASAVYAVLIARNRQTGLSPVAKESIVVGLALVLPLTLVTAGTMSGMGSHFVGGGGSDVGGLALTGWARDGGDLRVAHFFATHALHFIPLFGLVSGLVWSRVNRMPVRIFAAAYVAFVGFLFVQALEGRPFLAFL